MNVSGLDDAGRTARGLAADIRAVRSAWSGAVADPVADAGGYEEVAAAFRAAVADWRAELDVYADLLEGLGGAMTTSAAGYEDVDLDNAARLPAV